MRGRRSGLGLYCAASGAGPGWVLLRRVFSGSDGVYPGELRRGPACSRCSRFESVSSRALLDVTPLHRPTRKSSGGEGPSLTTRPAFSLPRFGITATAAHMEVVQPLPLVGAHVHGSGAVYVDAAHQSSEDVAWMRLALAQAQDAADHGEVPVGCVFVHDGAVLACARNRTNELMNATRHAELEAIEEIFAAHPPADPATFARFPHATNHILRHTTLYVTIEPCLMCGAALRQLGIQRVVYGAGNERFGGNGSVLGLHDDPAIALPGPGPGLSHGVSAANRDDADPARTPRPAYCSVGGYLREEAILMLREFYLTENPTAPKPQNKARRVLKTTVNPPGVSMHAAAYPSSASCRQPPPAAPTASLSAQTALASVSVPPDTQAASPPEASVPALPRAHAP